MEPYTLNDVQVSGVPTQILISIFQVFKVQSQKDFELILIISVGFNNLVFLKILQILQYYNILIM